MSSPRQSTPERHARRILGQIAATDRDALAADPKRALTERFGLRVREQDELAQRRDAGGWCDGISFLDDGVVLYAPSPFSRRENFTLTHELSHKLTEEDDDALDWLANRDQPERDLEQLCDLIAARLLLPDTLITRVLNRRPPEAAHIQALYEASAASEVVCAIALAQRLPCQGAIVIMDIGSSTVNHASVASPEDDGWPLAYPWPRQEIPAHHRLTRLHAGHAARERSWWATPWERGRTTTSTRSRAAAASTLCSLSETYGKSHSSTPTHQKPQDGPHVSLTAHAATTERRAAIRAPTAASPTAHPAKNAGAPGGTLRSSSARSASYP